MKKINSIVRPLLVLSFVILTLLIIPQLGTKDSGKTGEELARTHCSSCHLFPEPDLLTRHTWVNSVLPEMGLRLGIGDRNVELNRMSFKLFDHLCSLGIYPDKALIAQKDWNKIVRYYERNAPEKTLPQIQKEAKTEFEHPFNLKPVYLDAAKDAQVAMVRFMPSKKQIWIGKRNNELHILDLDLKIMKTVMTPSPIVDMVALEEPLLLGIGNMLPNEDRNGRVFRMNGKGVLDKMILDSLHRPVQVLRIDINNDRSEDILVAEFGFETGGLRWVDGKTGRSDVLSGQAGARNIIPRDVNKDGKMDLFVLFAQAKEEVVLFMNNGNGKFTPMSLLSFPSVHGTSFLDLKDMNGDGVEDMIITNGDNADYSIEKKHYHGVRIYLNAGTNVFRESFFYPVYGATKTLARDFDNDGDTDMAMIAFFSDKKDKESFLYFQNTGNGKFNISRIGIPYGQWLVMEADDMENDGDLDIMLGNFQMGTESSKSTDLQVQYLLLENLTVAEK